MDEIITNLLTVLQVSMPLVGILGAVGNVLVCVTIIYTKTLHNLTNLMILNLAVADALVCVCTPLEPFIAVNYLHLPVYIPSNSNSTECTANLLSNFNSIVVCFVFINCFSAHSVLSLTLANYERFIGISRPLQYNSYFTRRKIMLLLLAVWVIPVMVQMPRFIILLIEYQEVKCEIDELHESLVPNIAPMLLLLLPIVATIWMYIRILINLKQGARNLEDQGIHGPAQELHQAHKKVTSTLAIITTAFFILVLPTAIWYLFSLLLYQEINTLISNFIIWDIISFLALLNSTINPVLYGLKYKQLRKAFISMVCRCNQRRQPNQVGPL